MSEYITQYKVDPKLDNVEIEDSEDEKKDEKEKN